MNLGQLQEKMLAAARAHPPGEQVPYAFEKSTMARLKDSPALDVAALWARALWRAAGACVALALLLGVWSYIGVHDSPVNNAAAVNKDFSQRFEQTMLAAVNETGEIW
jgi:hypothetical protein